MGPIALQSWVKLRTCAYCKTLSNLTLDTVDYDADVCDTVDYDVIALVSHLVETDAATQFNRALSFRARDRRLSEMACS